MQKITCSPASLKDREQIYEMISDLEGVSLNKREFNKIFAANIVDSDIFYLAARHEGQLIGFAGLHIQKLLHHTGKIAELQELYVSPLNRGQGIGTQLLNKLKSIAKKNGCKNFEVACNLKRVDTHRFYLREGLKQTHYKFVEAL